MYIPLGHTPTAAPEQLDLHDVLGRLKPYFESGRLKKIGQNLKYDEHVLYNYGIKLNGIAGDAMLASYIVESHLGHGLDELAERSAGLPPSPMKACAAKAPSRFRLPMWPVEQATEYAAQDADFALRIEGRLKAQMDAKQLEMYEKLELPSWLKCCLSWSATACSSTKTQAALPKPRVGNTGIGAA